MAYPQTALRALLNESKRLFETAAFEIIAHGLNLHRTDIMGEKKINKIVKRLWVKAMYFNRTCMRCNIL